jgi:Dienelactone hydrolase family
MRKRILAVAIATTCLAVVSIPARSRIVSSRVGSTPEPVPNAASRGPNVILPAEKDARHLLGTTPRHLEWVAVPMGSKMVLAFVVSPERSDRAPVVLVTGSNQGASDWLRAIADQAAAAGFIAVVPDVLTGQGANGGDSDSFHTPDETARALAALGPKEIARRTEAVRAFEVASPASNGIGARLDFDVQASTMTAAVETGIPSHARAKFALTGAGLPAAIAFLQRETHDHPALMSSAGASANEHAEHFAMLAQAEKSRPEIGQPGAAGANTSYAQKRPDLPADFYTAKATIENSKLKKEWVELQVGDVKMRTRLAQEKQEPLSSCSTAREWIRGCAV